METGTIVWVVVAVLVLAVIIGLALWAARRGSERKVDRQRQEAAELRRDAEADRVDLQRREAEASRLDAQARLAQAEADTKAADAAQLQSQARQRADELSGPRHDVEERLRRADELDPEGRPDHRHAADGPVADHRAEHDRSVDDRPVDERYVDDRPVDERYVDDRPVDERPADPLPHDGHDDAGRGPVR